MRVAAVLVEYQSAGLKVNGISQLRGRGLIGINHASRIRLQINLHFTFRDDVSRLLVVFEVSPTDLVEAAGIASVESDLHVVQRRPSTLLELHCLARLYGKQRASLLRLRDGETGRTLPDFEANLLRNLFERVLHPMPSVKIRPSHQQHSGDDRPRKPAPQPG